MNDDVRVRLFFCGDVVLTNSERNMLIGSELAQYMDSCILKCCNLEAPIKTSDGLKLKKIGPSLHQSDKILDLIQSAGFNLCTLANNHIMDYGWSALEQTRNELQRHGLAYIGAGINKEQSQKPYIIQTEVGEIAFVSVAENGFGCQGNENMKGYAWFDEETFKYRLFMLCKKYKAVIVICHAGAEGWDVPLPELRKLYKEWIDIGVKTVVGHHPHVPQGLEAYKNGWIFYSLGNFAFDIGEGVINPNSIAAYLDIGKNGTVQAEILALHYDGKTVEISHNDLYMKHLERCSDLLLEKNKREYERYVDEYSSSAFENVYKFYYENALNVYSGGIKRLMKTVLMRYLQKKKFNENWLYHNLSIETHYWTCRRALKQH